MNARLSRPVVGFLALLCIALVLTLDLATSTPPDLFTAPPAFALGSGQAPGGAHCSGN
jgi:hypothetical protein